MPTRKNGKQRLNRSLKGGFSKSSDIWSFGICKTLIDAIGPAPAGTKKNWRECLNYLAERASVTPENLYNKMTPDEFLRKIFRDGVLGKTYYGQYKQPWEKFRDLWQQTASNRDAALKEDKTWGKDYRLQIAELPGKPMSEEQKRAKEEQEMEQAKQAFFQERSEFAGQPWYEARKQELEDGASIDASEECESRFGDGTADPGLCLAARKGTEKRIAKSEAAVKARARKAALNANAEERWGNAQGPLLALAATHANTSGNFARAYNGVPTGVHPTKKNPIPRLYEPGTGTWLTGRNIPPSWPVSVQERAWEPKYGPGYHAAKRGERWTQPPQQTGDYLKSDAVKEIMEQTYSEFPVSGPNKKLPERALYEQIVKALREVRYEKGYEDPLTHQPKLDVYDQALSRAMNWRRKGAVSN